jgi:group II intron reverse transcriptase/maturase
MYPETGETMETKLAGIAEVAKNKPEEKFTSLMHHVNEEMLMACHCELAKNKAPGIDKVTKDKYESNLVENLQKLVESLKQKSYRPQPVRRVYIPKGDGKTERPLGIPSYEDKIVQLALTKILQAIYEQDFLEFSYGFRPGRSCHDALKKLNQIIEWGKISYVVDVDIRGFFDNVDHKWLIEFLGHRIKDPNMIRYIVRFLKAGIMENGEWEPSVKGTPQGGVISPLLANIYLHYALDLWFDVVVKKNCRGEAQIVRYCDDFVCCFQYKEEAEWFYGALKERLAKFGLEIADEKSKIIQFGRFAEADCHKRGRRKPDTFDFLGFTHYCSKSRNGKFRVKRKTSKKKFKAKVKAVKAWIKSVRNLHILDIWSIVRLKLIGHYRYYGITDNFIMLKNFLLVVQKLMFKWLNRRSQRRSFNLEQFDRFIKFNPLHQPKIYVNIYG